MKDANDNGPVFEHKIYNATVKESLPIGSSIVTVRASDADYDNNGKVTYTLTSDDSEDENFFRYGHYLSAKVYKYLYTGP